MNSSPVRLAHFSDIHVTAKPLGWRPRDLLTKRATGWINLKLSRGRQFCEAAHIVRAMMLDIRERGNEHIVFSGDATALGFESEFSVAARCLDLNIRGLAVPGNHDYYVQSTVRARHFEHFFTPWQQGERIGVDTYPFAQKAGHCWLVGVCSARANTLLWDACGEVDEAQRQRLVQLLKSLTPGPRILVTHYPLYLADGEPEHRWRLLRDWQGFRRLAVDNGISLWLHGHRHSAYVLESSRGQPFPIICAGSATQTGRWSWNEYVIEGLKLTMNRRMWQPDERKFIDAESRVIELE
jgi:3',5'-cyclic AMP phosphodiesterase CpdA